MMIDTRRDAHLWARKMRSERDRLIEEVASGAMTLDGLFAERAAGVWCDMVKVVVLAQKVPGVGKVRSRRAMGQLCIGEDARFGEIDPAVLRSLWSTMAESATRPL
jgi:hypothetical protein